MACGKFQAMSANRVERNDVAGICGEAVAILHRGAPQRELMATPAQVAAGPVGLHAEVRVSSPAQTAPVTVGLVGSEQDVYGERRPVALQRFTQLYIDFLKITALAQCCPLLRNQCAIEGQPFLQNQIPCKVLRGEAVLFKCHRTDHVQTLGIYFQAHVGNVVIEVDFYPTYHVASIEVAQVLYLTE